LDQELLVAQGFEIHDNVIFQDNQSAMLLEKNGRASSGRQTRHINIRYFFVTNRVQNGEVRIDYCPTGEMLVADFFTKPLKGSLFRKLRGIILNSPDHPQIVGMATLQECVENRPSYADVVRGTHRQSSDVADVARHTIAVNTRMRG
jgi:hypothetical protein